MIKSQIARGVKNVNTDVLMAAEGSKSHQKVDVTKMIAEEQRRAQNQRMNNIVEGISKLNEKSIDEAYTMEGIKEFIKYKYPMVPSVDEVG